MSDVRDQLVTVCIEVQDRNVYWSVEQMADAILERFDVTPKPAVTEGDMAMFIDRAFRNSEQQNGVLMNWNMNNVANRLLLELEREGLEIVRVDE